MGNEAKNTETNGTPAVDSNDTQEKPRVQTPFSIAGAASVRQREDRGAKFYLRDEHGEPLMTLDSKGALVQAFAVVAGKLSQRYREAEQRVNDRTLKKRNLELSAEMLVRNEREKIASCVISWNLTDSGTPIPCDVFNVSTVLEAAPWIQKDFDTWMGEPSRFLV